MNVESFVIFPGVSESLFFFSSLLTVFHTEQILLIVPQVHLFTLLSSPRLWSLSTKFIVPIIILFIHLVNTFS